MSAAPARVVELDSTAQQDAPGRIRPLWTVPERLYNRIDMATTAQRGASCA
jgi:hypothetical protein